ncbi:MAG: hypothetical protein QX190_10660 [Methylococcales bacterium]
MDKHYTLNGIAFVWYEDKAAKNPVKHDGVSFEQAAQAFLILFCL